MVISCCGELALHWYCAADAVAHHYHLNWFTYNYVRFARVCAPVVVRFLAYSIEIIHKRRQWHAINEGTGSPSSVKVEVGQSWFFYDGHGAIS